MKKPLTLLFAFAALVALAFIVLDGGDQAPERARTSPTAPPIEPAVADSGASLTPLDVAEHPDDVATATREAEDDAPDDGAELVVQVWDGAPGQPAANAEVYLLDDDDGIEDYASRHWSAHALVHGLRTTTDEDGRARLPAAQSWTAIATARLENSYGFTRVGIGPGQFETIVLVPDETLTVRVVDSAGEGVADVPVGILQSVPTRQDPEERADQLARLTRSIDETERWMKQNPTQRDRAAAKVNELNQEQTRLLSAPLMSARDALRVQRRTNLDGVAVVEHFQAYRTPHDDWWPPQFIDRFRAELLIPLLQPAGVPFAGQPAPTDPIEITLPPTGSLTLRTVDVNGRPFTHPVSMELRKSSAAAIDWNWVPGWGSAVSLDDGDVYTLARKPADTAEIEFPFVGVGVQFAVRARLDDDDFKWDAPIFAGPTRPGEALTVDLLVAPGEGMLTGRLLDDAGRAMSDATVLLLINSPAGRLEGEEVVLDDEGRFHLPYKLRDHHRAPFRFEVRREEAHPMTGLAMTVATLSPGSVTDLGDLIIGDLGQLAHGVVTDDRGEAIAGATINLQREREVGGDQPRMEFVDEAFSVVRTDDEGRYELFGTLDSGRHRLRAEARDHFPVSTSELTPGTRIDLTLARKSTLIGNILMPTWMRGETLRVRLQSVTDPSSRREDQVHDKRDKAYIYFDWVTPGTYDVSVRTRDFPDPVLSVDGLVVLPGQTEPHPRLTDLDLGAHLFHFEVTAVDESGDLIDPQRPLLARIVRPNGEAAFVGFPWEDGEAEIVSASPVLDVTPLAQGFVAEPTVLSQGRSELRFLRIPPVELHLPGLSQLVGVTPAWISMTLVGDPALPAQLETWDRHSGRIARWYGGSKTSYVRLANRDTVQVAVARNGRYVVRATLGRRTRNTRQVRVDLGAVTVKLVPGAAPPRITVPYERSAVEEKLAELSP